MKVDANGLLTTVEQYPECNNLMYGYPYCATGITATAGNAHDEVLINLYPRLQYIMPQSVTLALGETAPYIEPRAVEDDRTLCSYFPVIHFDTTIAKLVRLETDPPSLAIMGVAPGSTQMYFIASSGKLCRSSQPGFVVTVIP